MKNRALEHFDFLSPIEVSNCQISIPASTPYKVNHILKSSSNIKIEATFRLVDDICYNYDLEYPSLECARAAGWAV